MSIFDKFKKTKKTESTLSIPCPFCGNVYGLPSSLNDFGDVVCPYCQKVGMRMPCQNCGKVFVFKFSEEFYTPAKCSHCGHSNMVIHSGSRK